eukprot:Em0003g1768a
MVDVYDFFVDDSPVPTNEANSKTLQEHRRRTKVAIEENAVNELQNLDEYVPDLSDADARVLALRMYYIELADGVSPNDAQEKVGKMFLICKRTVERWAASWEQTKEESLTDQRTATMHNEEYSILFLCPTLVFELRNWIKKRIQQAGKHKDGYLTIQQI